MPDLWLLSQLRSVTVRRLLPNYIGASQTQGCEQLTQSHYTGAPKPGVKLVSCLSQVRCNTIQLMFHFKTTLLK